jgi:hypothetical protein
MKKLLRYCGLAALLAGAALFFSSCDDEEVRKPYGGPWKITKTPPEVYAAVKDIFFLDADTGWASAYENFLRWNGREWVIQKTFIHPDPEIDYGVKPIWAFAEDDIWVGGCEVLPGREYRSKIWHFNGAYWEDVKHPDVGGIGYLWFNSPNDGWAFGGYYMLRWDGKKWYQTEWLSSATTGVWFNSPDDGWRTTPAYIYHWDGVNWARVAECGSFEAFYCIAFNRPGSGWAGLGEGFEGYPHMFHCDGGEWDYYRDTLNSYILDIDFSGPGYGCAAGVQAYIFDNDVWINTHTPGAALRCIECVGPDDIWAGSDTGDIYHFTGT